MPSGLSQHRKHRKTARVKAEMGEAAAGSEVVLIQPAALGFVQPVHVVQFVQVLSCRVCWMLVYLLCVASCLFLPSMIGDVISK